MTMSLGIQSISIPNLTSPLYYFFCYLILSGYPNKLWILYSLPCHLGVSFLPSCQDIFLVTAPSFPYSRDNLLASRSLTFSYPFRYCPVRPTRSRYRTCLIWFCSLSDPLPHLPRVIPSTRSFRLIFLITICLNHQSVWLSGWQSDRITWLDNLPITRSDKPTANNLVR
jgi:hypothetical protein